MAAQLPGPDLASPFANLRLRTWLLALIAVAVLPSFFILVINYQNNHAIAFDRAEASMEAVARLAAATHEQSMEGVRQILGTISSGPSVRRYDLEQLCKEFIGNVAAASPSYSNIGVLTLEGKARCIQNEHESLIDFSDRQYFKEALRSQSFTVGEYLEGRVSEKRALTFSVPVYDYEDKLKGVAYVGLDLELVDQRFKVLRLDPALEVFLLNAEGLLLASTQLSQDDIGRTLSFVGVQSMLTGQRVNRVHSGDSRNGPALYLLTPVNADGRAATFVAVRALERDVFGPGIQQLRLQLVALLASAAAGVFAAWVVARRRITLPISQLIRRMGVAAQGRYGAAADSDHSPASSFEFNVLNQNLSRMLEEIQLQQAAVASSIDGIVICDATQADYPMVYVNPAFERITGYAAADVLGKSCKFLQGSDYDQSGVQQIRLALAEQRDIDVVLRNYRRDGSLFWNSLRIAPVRDTTGAVTHFVGVQTDVTRRVQSEEELARLAHHDWLTGLPNRKLLEDRISLGIERAKRERTEFSVAFIDLDNFKIFNDRIGHAAGDTVLVEVARRLAATIRAEDTVCRLGGDEFVVMYEGLGDSAPLHDALVRLQHKLQEPIELGGKEYFVAASIGIVTFPRDGDSAQSLIQHADVAMYKAKADGRGVVRVYSPSLENGGVEKFELANSLRKGLANQEFELHYQPKVDAATGQLSGTEALVRWRHPEHGLVPPAQFIPLAEQTGLIVVLGRWVLEEACAQMQRWRSEGVMDLPVAVNVSAIQFRQDDLSATIAAVLQKTGLPGERLHIELTESVMIDGQDSLYRTLNDIKSLGVGIAMDDFGTGYSSLSYLKRFPIDYVKIDQSFVRDISTDPADAEICSAIIAMAHNLGMKVIAEGVETQEQADFLRTRGCDQLQGYLIGRPCAPDDTPTLHRLFGAT